MNAYQSYLMGGTSPTGTVVFCPTNNDMLQSACKALLVLPYNATPVPFTTTLNKVVKVRNLTEALALYGSKTVAYRLLEKAFAACPSNMAEINVVALPVLDGAVAPVYDLVIGGAATSAHIKTISLLGKDYSIYVADEASVATIATAFKAVFDADPLFPFTVTTTLTGLHFVGKDKGEFLNGMTIDVTDSRVGTVIADTTIALTATTAGTGALDSTSFLSAVGNCSYKCVAISDSSQLLIDAVQAWIKVKGACGPDYSGQMGWFARKETIGAALTFGDGVTGESSAYNEVIIGLHVSPDIPYLPCEVAVTRAVMSCCGACADPGNPLQNEQSKMLALPFASDCNGLYSRDEMNDLFRAGWSIITSIDGYLGLEMERTFHRWNEEGKPTIAYSDPTQIRIVEYFYNDMLKPALVDEFGSTIIFKDGTNIPMNLSLGDNAPAFMRDARATTPTRYRGWLVSFCEGLVGKIFDAQDFKSKIHTFTDDQLRGLCQGDPRVLVAFFDQIAIARPARQFFLSFNYTTRTC